MAARTAVPAFVVVLVLLLHASPPAGAGEGDAAFPPGSAAAVKAVKCRFPCAVVDEAARPQGFGAGAAGEPPLYWDVRYHDAEGKHEVPVTPEGTLIRLRTSVEAKALPPAVAEAVAKAAPGANVLHATKEETLAAMRYAALPKAEVVYVAEVVKGEAKESVSVPGEEGGRCAPPPGAEKIADPKARAFEAVKAEFPGAVLDEVELVGYSDDTGDMDILAYEVEFRLGGAKKELNVSPDGVLIEFSRVVESKDLPAAVAQALSKAADGGTVGRIVRRETRAGLRFVALPAPKVIYEIEHEEAGKKESLRVRADGHVVPAFQSPWKSGG